MLNGADEGSDCGVSPMASPSKEFTATLQNDGRTQSSLQKGARATFWGLKHFQWYLTVLAILVLVAISLASSYIDGVGDNTRGILDVLDVKASTVSRVITGVKWVIAATWALAGTTMLASVFAAVNKFYVVRRRETFDRHAADCSISEQRTWRACIGFNFSRALLNTVHVFVLLTAWWFIVLLCAGVACVTLFYFVDEAVGRAMGNIVAAETETNIFTETITEWMKKHSEDLTSLSSTINTLCAATTCPPDLQGAIGTLNELDSEVARVTDTLTEAEAVVCPSTSCINLDQIWFLEADGCVCASTTVRAVREYASAAAEDAFWASIWTAVALLATLLMVSKTAMNLKSLLKDERWIKRMRRIFAKLASRGVRLGPDDSAFLHTSSSATRFQELVYAALPSTSSGTLPPPAGAGTAAVAASPSGRWRQAAAAAVRRLPSRRRRSVAPAEPGPRHSAELVAVELSDTAPATSEGRWDALQSLAGEEEPYAEMAIEHSLKQMLDRASSRRAGSLTPSDKLHSPEHYLMLSHGPSSPRSTPSFVHPPAPSPLPTASTFTLDRSSNESSPDSAAAGAPGGASSSPHVSLRVASDASNTAAVSAPGGAPDDWHTRLAAMESESPFAPPRPVPLQPRRSGLDPAVPASAAHETGPEVVGGDALAPMASPDSAFAITVKPPIAAAMPLSDRPPAHPGIPQPLVPSTLPTHTGAAPAGAPASRASSGFVTAPSEPSGSSDGSPRLTSTAEDSDVTDSGRVISGGLSVRQSGPLPLTPAALYDSSSGTIRTVTGESSMSPELPFLMPPGGARRQQHPLFRDRTTVEGPPSGQSD